jgi:hypothetical protein
VRTISRDDILKIMPEVRASASKIPYGSQVEIMAKIRAFAERLRSRGKARMTIVAAAMRKLLTLAYGVLKSDRAFDPAFGAA